MLKRMAQIGYGFIKYLEIGYALSPAIKKSGSDSTILFATDRFQILKS